MKGSTLISSFLGSTANIIDVCKTSMSDGICQIVLDIWKSRYTQQSFLSDLQSVVRFYIINNVLHLKHE